MSFVRIISDKFFFFFQNKTNLWAGDFVYYIYNIQNVYKNIKYYICKKKRYKNKYFTQKNEKINDKISERYYIKNRVEKISD